MNIDRVIALFEGNEIEAQNWMSQPNRALKWKTPSELMASEAGTDEVMKLITRLEHGVYS
ncbi:MULTISPECIES: MbcA/ParS/Xre antitoxin family protein [Leclercia]|uniref:MbcA/ParS/Xre antitoxin family protein n=1 Tax=Leclercia adecarboxylata TaxID=83655 RepID=A0ABU6I923_9ENTR|nr:MULTISPECIES: MbcA/ParS/Xre antitoxin family protein [Leclercia]MCG1034562.1 DUF2384 domain-containing protein [Bacillus amyloliquefaciens]AXF67327.1 DUF2384 domain-containing protein [Leclercia sp. W17]MBW9398660.1 DUF2384 domain-containing protein [Leclercia sp. EC_58]MDH0064487.1 MbcA/ParS/Xre antitoxin family protein [Leclercia adecarboxylata]MEC3904273.1 MbcA/ParS/Xre antitoxin family protein [Leclercia adecarboxylata]